MEGPDAFKNTRTSKKLESKKELKGKKGRHEADPSNASLCRVVLLPPPRAENLARDRSLSCDGPDYFLFLENNTRHIYIFSMAEPPGSL